MYAEYKILPYIKHKLVCIMKVLLSLHTMACLGEAQCMKRKSLHIYKLSEGRTTILIVSCWNLKNEICGFTMVIYRLLGCACPCFL